LAAVAFLAAGFFAVVFLAAVAFLAAGFFAAVAFFGVAHLGIVALLYISLLECAFVRVYYCFRSFLRIFYNYFRESGNNSKKTRARPRSLETHNNIG